MKKVAANIVKGIFERLNSTQRGKNDSSLGWLQHKWIKHQEDQQIKQLKIKDLVIYYQRPYELLHTYQDLFVNELYRFHTTEKAPLIIDCGSNIGISLLYFKKLYPAAIIHCYEPDENNFKLLSLNVEKNNLESIYKNKEAIWVKDGTISFDSKATEASHITESNNEGTTTVNCTRLATILQQHAKIYFLKIDIEGAEWEVMKDCAAYLNKVENLFLEYHGKVDETYKLSDLLSILKEANFSVYVKNAADSLQHPFVEKTTNTAYDVQLNLFCYR